MLHHVVVWLQNLIGSVASRDVEFVRVTRKIHITLTIMSDEVTAGVEKLALKTDKARLKFISIKSCI